MSALLVAVLLIWLLSEIFILPRVRAKRRRQALIENFGKRTIDPPTPDDIENVAEYGARKYEHNNDPSVVDASTWSDLDMDKVFLMLNRTESDVGECTLHAMMHDTGASSEALRRRIELADWFRAHERERTDVLTPISRIGKRRFSGVNGFLFSPEQKDPGKSWLYIALAVTPIVVLICGIFLPALLLLYAALFAVNLIVYYRMNKLWDIEQQAVAKLAAVSGCIKALAQLRIPELEPELAELRALNESLRPLLRWTSLYTIKPDGPLAMIAVYIKIMCQFDMISLCQTAAFISANRWAVQRAYEAVGELDAIISIASLSTGRGGLVVPEFSDELAIEAVDIAHPLLKNPVTNSFRWDKDMLITGSNASGKSTFAKTIAVNCILAQTLGLAFAASLKLPHANVISAMASRDSVVDGESYFVAEIKSLKRILDALETGRPALCFIDEILRGTNTIERIASSSALLAHLHQQHALVLAATHDRELTKILSGQYENYHFREELNDGGMSFSYKLLDGPSSTKNAILLLSHMGFPNEVTEAAQANAARFERDQKW